MAAKEISFSHIESAPELAKVLNVDTNTLYCTSVIVPLTICTVDGCIYPALLRNGQSGHSAGPRCTVHRQDWFPTPGNCGSLLLGQEYLRPKEKSKRKTCLCLNKTCLGIGYSPSYVSVLRSKHIRETVVFKALCQGMDILGDSYQYIKEKLFNNKDSVVLAPWHFWPIHRTKNETTGGYVLIPYDKDTVFYDNEKKSWTGFPPPNYSPKQFVEEELPPSRTHPRGRWIDKLKCDLPDWTIQYKKAEQAVARKAAEQEK